MVNNNFIGKIFYKKNEGFQTLTSANGDVLFRSIFESFSSSGALDEKNIERIENLFSIIKEREGLINAYYAALQKEAVFNPKLKSVLEQAHYLP